MLKRLTSFASRHKFITVLVIGAVAFGGHRVYKSKAAVSGTPTYLLGAVEKGTLISSVSGSGQVSATDQLDLKAKASGEVTFVGVKSGQKIKKGTVIARIDSRDAAKAVRDAQTALETAKLSLEKLQAPTDALSATQAQNSVTAAERNVSQAEATLAQYLETSKQTTATAADDGYIAVSDAFLDMPNHMKDLKDLRGTSTSPDGNVAAYKLILGSESPLVKAWLHDHDAALTAYESAFAYFKTVPREADAAVRYDLMKRAEKAALAVSQALGSAHAMLDAAVNTSYKQYDIAPTIDAMRPKILSDIGQNNGDISSIQRSITVIDNDKRDYPINVKKYQDAVAAAKESLDERRKSLAKQQAGPDALDLRSAQISVQQRQDALADAQRAWADYTVVAPFDATVATFTLKKGDQLSNGGTVATLVTDQRFADMSLNEIDVTKVNVGQKVTLTFDAVEGLSISGEVVDVDLLGGVSQGVVSYGVRIRFDTQDERVRPGMSMSAAIVTDVRTDVLLVPSTAVKSQGGVSYVQVLPGHEEAGSVTTDEMPEMRMVEVGGSNDSQTEIISGLEEGDVIVTRTVAASSSASNAAARPQTGGIGGFAAPAGGVRMQSGPAMGGGNVMIRTR